MKKTKKTKPTKKRAERVTLAMPFGEAVRRIATTPPPPKTPKK